LSRLAPVAFALAFALGVIAGCSVNLPTTLLYTCTADRDCASGQVCSAPSGGAGQCCVPGGTEVCDGLDNDCNGLVDDSTAREVCDGVDNDCNGQTDELFNLQLDNFNCGRCGKSCSGEESCNGGQCLIRSESSCLDGVDNDKDGKIDCLDPDCNLVTCGPGCQCRALLKFEGNCNNTVDDDGDGVTDCADPDCAGAGCGDGGCFCAGGVKTESGCNDTADNDGDGQSDCLDGDCGGRLCQAGPATFRCAGTTCACNDGGVLMEAGARCRNFVDDDCDGLVDCAEAACATASCSPDGGAGCQCGGGIRNETNCADRQDNDSDGTTDCGDALPDGGGDCPRGTACTFLNIGGMVTAGTCAADRTCKQ
jgi:Putative metal-binding motif